MNTVYLLLPMFATTRSFVQQRLYNATTFELKISFNFIDLSMCFVYKIRLVSFFLPVITQVINLLNGIKSSIQFKIFISIIIDDMMIQVLSLVLFFPFLIRRRLSFLKTFLVPLLRASWTRHTHNVMAFLKSVKLF